jgi:signal transduction histidine kinase
MAATMQRLRGRELLRAVAEGTASSVGDEFLRCLVRHVAEALSAKMVLVTEASDPEGRHVRMLAGWYDGAPIDQPIEYETRGQPCALVPGESVVAYPEQLAKHFPDDLPAIQMGLDSYLAVCLRDSQGTYLGHLAVLDTRRMEAGQDDVAALRIFAARAGAELERRNQEKALAASRARVIEAADAERRRFGRDLHDGAQQRLLAVSNLLKVARKKAGGADDLLAMAQDELTAAHAELRELARGLHPVALADRGLPAAIESLTSVSTVPVEVEVCEEPLPDQLAACAYFVIAECLTNASRYGQATKLRVCVANDGEQLEIEVSDDGVGGADLERGTGLRGLVDRLDLLCGDLEVHSPVGEGTTIRARVPLQSSQATFT